MARKKKAKSAIKIGADSEAEYEAMLINDGWITYRPPKGNRWEKNKDIYNVFDIMGLRSDGIRFSQVKTNERKGRATKPVEDWVKANKSNIPQGTKVTIEVAIKRKATKKKPVRWEIIEIDWSDKYD